MIKVGRALILLPLVSLQMGAVDLQASTEASLFGTGYRTTISASQKGGCIYIDVLHENESPNEIYLKRDKPVFHMMSPAGKFVPYAGPFIDEPSTPLSAYVTLRKGERYRTSIDLNSQYDMRKKGKYLLTLNVDYVDPVSKSINPRGDLTIAIDYKGACKSSINSSRK